jgi:hypothetical protein
MSVNEHQPLKQMPSKRLRPLVESLSAFRPTFLDGILQFTFNLRYGEAQQQLSAAWVRLIPLLLLRV